MPGVKRGSHTLAVALGIDVCTAVQQRQNARYVAGAALLGQRERRAVLDRSAFISKLLAARSTAAAELCCAAVTLPLTMFRRCHPRARRAAPVQAPHRRTSTGDALSGRASGRDRCGGRQ